MRTHTISFRTRYSETDQMGIIYYGNYPQFLEMGRVEWLRHLDVSYKTMEASGIMLPVVNLNLQYKKPAVYDQIINVTTILRCLPSRKIEFDYQIINEDGELLTTAYTALIFVNAATKRPVQCPNYILEKLQHIDFSDAIDE